MAVPNTFQTATSAIPLANLDANFTYYDNAFSISGTATTFTGTATATKLIPTGSSATGNGLYLPAANSVGLSTNGTNAVYINSTQNVGIGTSSPSSKLDVRGNASFTGNATLRQTANFGNTGGDFYVGVESSAGGAVFGGSSAYAGIVGTNNATSLQLATNGTIKATIDSSGNVGIGVTSVTGKFQVKAATNQNFYIGASTTIANSVVIGGINDAASANIPLEFRYGTTAAFINSGTEAMRIDSSGLLLIGTTSNTGGGRVDALSNATSAYTARSASSGASTTVKAVRSVDSGASNFANAQYDALSHAWQLSAGTAAMTLDSSGNLLVGTTSQLGGTAKFSVVQTSGWAGFYQCANGGSGVGITNTSGTASYTAMAFFNNGTSYSQVGSIDVSGSVTTYNVTSDYRLKNIAGPVTTSGVFIDSLKPVQGSWKADGSRFIGFLAHELQEASETVVGTGVKDGEEMQSIDYSNAELIANLVAEIQSLRKRLTALEST